jgi:hypothetical protein
MSTTFKWRGIRRPDRPLSAAEVNRPPDEPNVTVTEHVYRRIATIARRRGVSLRQALEIVVKAS